MEEHCEESKIAKLPSQTRGGEEEEEGGVGAKTIYTGEKNLDETRHKQTSCVQLIEGKAEKSFVLPVTSTTEKLPCTCERRAKESKIVKLLRKTSFSNFKKAASEQRTIYTRRMSLKIISLLTHNHQQVDFQSELSEN